MTELAHGLPGAFVDLLRWVVALLAVAWALMGAVLAVELTYRGFVRIRAIYDERRS